MRIKHHASATNRLKLIDLFGDFSGQNILDASIDRQGDVLARSQNSIH